MKLKILLQHQQHFHTNTWLSTHLGWDEYSIIYPNECFQKAFEIDEANHFRFFFTNENLNQWMNTKFGFLSLSLSLSPLLLRASRPYGEERKRILLHLKNKLQHSNNNNNNRSSFIIEIGFEWLVIFFFVWFVFSLINIRLIGDEIMWT